MTEDLMLRGIQGLGFDALIWLNPALDWFYWSNVCQPITVEECSIGTGCWSFFGY